MSSKAQSKDAPTNPRGIPHAPFVDKVDDYVSSRTEVDGTMKSFQEMISKYQFMEANTQRRKAGLDEKIPDIQKTLDTVRFLKSQKVDSLSGQRPWRSFFSNFAIQPDSDPLEATFELNDTLYAKALVPATEEVYLWLGANVMLSYPIAEAETLLEGKLSGAQQTLENCEEDLDFLREQITTLEVATARVYNWDVTMKRKEKAESREGVDGKKKGLPNG
ncbi:MAG: peptide chain release factor 1 [Alectoria fallacina]|uniref:Prefoldin subunit 3 n=1 Tax=Alectoria fallacina TaxID=1903189 RepID=A0A8H3IH28_9LECA|nr:MAG: peptide chain release factor 1 [Alectoria fallacina]